MVVTSTQLTNRELEILRYVARGWEFDEIAVRMGISHATVRTHMARMRKLANVHNKTALCVWARKEGFIP